MIEPIKGIGHAGTENIHLWSNIFEKSLYGPKCSTSNSIVLDDLESDRTNYSVNYMYKLYIALLSWGMRTIKLPYSQKT